MNRKLHNTFLGLTASTAMLSLALVLGAPAARPAPVDDTLAAAIELEVRLALAEAGIEVEQADSTGGTQSRRRSRQSVLVPYFSFAPRG